MANLPPKLDSNGSQDPQKKNQSDLKLIQNLALIASILGPVSLVFGGILVGSAAVIIAGISIWRVTQLIKQNQSDSVVFKELRKTCIFALLVSSIALALNIFSFIYVYPTLVETFGEQLSQGPYSEDAVPKGLKTWG